MSPRPIRCQPEPDAPVCEVNVVHQDVVSRLKPEVERMEGVATVFKALADDTRVKIVYALSQAELCVCDVAALIGSTKATASYHLRLLHHMGLAKYRREGKLVYYRLADSSIGNLVREVLHHLHCDRGEKEAGGK
ncbi:ArsR/SmtB family transcription factor [Calditerricola satsumensis]|uniref:Transcriptional regulator n=1 Tax=Calditerricola satsumensis TaxID=373054 RepID=A0A8J3BAQ1_9BACI|nr:metalloregulator ArsR/SmtB family transcription factor [Calditerricola satsumensis]GGJ93613.1 transcriptional regulator [Calditerricola satsumensis]